MHVLVTGATGKVGQAFLARFLADERWSGASVRALCHNRSLLFILSALVGSFHALFSGDLHGRQALSVVYLLPKILRGPAFFPDARPMQPVCTIVRETER